MYALMAVLALTQVTQAQSFNVLYTFSGTPGGENPYGTPLVQDGVLYGTTVAGGGSNRACLGEGETCGTVFQFDLASRTETVLHDFVGSPDGALPYAGVFRDAAGNLYGTTDQGGTANYGVVFEVDVAATESVLHSFNGTDGAWPWGGLVGDSQGNLFGATGGTTVGSRLGTLFELNPSGQLTTLTSVYSSLSALRLKSAELYGTDATAGTYGDGTVFAFNALNRKMTVLYTFTGGADGGYPEGSLTADSSGNLYGTTACGGSSTCTLGSGGNGVVFMLNPLTGEQTVLHAFGGYPDGVQPNGQLVIDSSGNVYGVTAFGGSNLCNSGSIGCGTVFKLTPPAAPGGTWTETILHNFTGDDGWEPLSGLTADSRGHLYGVCFLGGSNLNAGTLFELTP